MASEKYDNISYDAAIQFSAVHLQIWNLKFKWLCVFPSYKLHKKH